MSLLFLIGWVFAGALSHYESGIQLLSKKKYPQAIEEFQQALQKEGIDPNIYHGLGNALYGQGHKVLALAAWRRGLLLEPSHSLLQHNVQQIGGVLPPHRFWQRLSIFQWSLFGIILGSAALIFLGIPRSRARLMSAWLCLASCSLCAYFAWKSTIFLQQGLILQEKVVASSAPNGRGIEVFTLQIRDEVRLIDHMGEKAVLVANSQDQKGWISSSSVLSLGPWDDFSVPMR